MADNIDRRVSASYSDVCLWRRDRLQQYLRERGLPTTGKVEELRALVFGAEYFNISKKLTAKEEDAQRALQYRNLLTVKCPSSQTLTVTLPDPFSDVTNDWVGEEKGMYLWPPCMSCDISEYLVESGETDLRTRLMTDYKEGKAYSYFDSRWLKQVFYHPISPESQYCFLKAECTPSMNINNLPHRLWVCLMKKTGKVVSGYCTCFAGLGATCNHIAALLFKLDYAWQNGFTNKSCTSLPAEWTAPSTKKSFEMKKLSAMEWRKPHFRKQNKTIINPAARTLFSPTSQSAGKPSLEALMGSLFLSCPGASCFQYAAAEAKANYNTEDDVNVEGEELVETTAGMPGTIKVLLMEGSIPTLSMEQITIVEAATKGQSANPVWTEQRCGRITGSTAHMVLVKHRKIRNGRDPGNMDTITNAIVGKDSFLGDLPAIKYGREMEPVARQKYLEIMKQKGHKNVKVEECGLFVHHEHAYMAASPDGIISCECCGEGLLEIKCPYSVAGRDIQSCPPAYLVPHGDEVTLKNGHMYHTQVAMQLAVTKYDWCDFFVYSSGGYHLQRIYKAKITILISELEQAASLIFSRYVMPELLSPEMDTTTGDAQPVATLVEPNSGTTLLETQPEGEATPGPSRPVALQKKRRRPQRSGKTKKVCPIYLCDVCDGECKEVDNISDSIEYSVGCDLCYKWFHWGCVNFHGNSDVWYCMKCKTN